jgi:hypothetical protein
MGLWSTLGGVAGGVGGFMVGGPGGALSGYGAGSSLGSNFDGSDLPDIPEVDWSPESLAYLEENFPEYAAQIKTNQLAYGDLSRYVASMQQGPTQSEKQGISDQMNQVMASQSMSGMSGTPMGNAMQADAYNRMAQAANDQAFQRAMSAAQAQQNAGAQLASQYGNLGQLQNAGRGYNIDKSMSMDMLPVSQAMYMRNMAQQAETANNQNNLGWAGLGVNIMDRWK